MLNDRLAERGRDLCGVKMHCLEHKHQSPASPLSHTHTHTHDSGIVYVQSVHT